MQIKRKAIEVDYKPLVADWLSSRKTGGLV